MCPGVLSAGPLCFLVPSVWPLLVAAGCIFAMMVYIDRGGNVSGGGLGGLGCIAQRVS